MAKEEEIMRLYEEGIVTESVVRLSALEILLKHKLKTAMDEDIIEHVVEMNTIWEFVAGEDLDLYEKRKYRLFRDIEGKLFVIQGEEIDVDEDPEEYESPNED